MKRISLGESYICQRGQPQMNDLWSGIARRCQAIQFPALPFLVYHHVVFLSNMDLSHRCNPANLDLPADQNFPEEVNILDVSFLQCCRFCFSCLGWSVHTILHFLSRLLYGRSAAGFHHCVWEPSLLQIRRETLTILLKRTPTGVDYGKGIHYSILFRLSYSVCFMRVILKSVLSVLITTIYISDSTEVCLEDEETVKWSDIVTPESSLIVCSPQGTVLWLIYNAQYF